MQDIYVRRGDVAGTREGVSVFYDSGGAFQGKNKYFEGKTRQVCGDVFAVWTQVAEDNTTACDDVILDRKLTEGDFVKYIKSFEDDLAGFVRRGSHPQLRVHYDLFPNIKRVWFKDGSASYTVGGVDISAGRTLSRFPSGGQYDVDLLTHRFKWRTYCHGFGFPHEKRYVTAFTQEYRCKYCVACSKAISAKCSRCGQYYSCGGPECRKKAWKQHKPVCCATGSSSVQ
ncbi:unnamed protein product [Ectocarpus sp. 12 AP-2014]